VSGTPASGDAFFLVQGTSGLVHGSGFAYQLTYDVSGGDGEALQLNVHPMPSSGWGGAFLYSPCPRELEISNAAANGTTASYVATSESTCQAAQDCAGPVPAIAEICADGSSAGLSWGCVGGSCKLVSGCE